MTQKGKCLNYYVLFFVSYTWVKSIQSALIDLLTTSATHAWHVFPPKYELWTHFNRPWTEYQCQGVVWTLLMIFTESVNRSTFVSVYLIITRLRNVNLLCFSDSIEGIDFLNCTLKCPVTLKLASQNRYFY